MTTPSISFMRPELQGLRAIAIGMVVCYHIWFSRVSGGVDVFLLISAFLMTGSFVRKIDGEQPLSPVRYWIHTFKRLLPPATVVILGTLLAGWLIWPRARWTDLVQSAKAAIFQQENLFLIERATDYYAADHSAALPLQHFWSLSIQGQVFLAWPLIFVLAAVIARHTGVRAASVLWIAFGGIFLASFAWSVYFTAANQTVAYFDTRTRVWEFALGSLLALALPWFERRIGYRDGVRNNAAHARAAAGWVGLVLILSAGWVLDVSRGFPGYVAVWPTLAACLVIAAGPTGVTWGADRVLSSRPLRFIGDISYALYLVHWPILVAVLVATDRAVLDPLAGSMVIGASLVTAWVLTRCVDSPIRYSTWLKAAPWRGIGVIACCLLLVRGVANTAQDNLDAERQAELDPAVYTGAMAIVTDDLPVAADVAMPSWPGADIKPLEFPCEGRWEMTEDEGFPDSDGNPATSNCQMLSDEVAPDAPTVAIVGSSHAFQFTNPVVALAEEYGWQVVTVHRNGCPWGYDTDGSCDAWTDAVVAYLGRIGADAALTQTTYSGIESYDVERLAPGADRAFAALLDEGVDVIGLRDNPRFNFDILACGQRHGPDAEECSRPVEVSLALDDPSTSLPHEGTDGARLYSLDLTDVLCPDGVCRPVAGNINVWIDRSHVSQRYTSTLTPIVKERLRVQGFGLLTNA